MKDFSTLSTEDLEKEIARVESLMSNTQDEDTILRREAENNGVDYNLFKAIDQHESGGRKDAVSHTGVQGRFQITGDTFRRYGGTNRDDFNDVAKVAGKIVGGLKQKYNGDIPKMMAAYNTGEGVVDEAERLAAEKGTNWLDELPNTKSIDKVTDEIMRAKLRRGVKVGTFDEEKASKIKEVENHRNAIMSIYNKNLTRDFSKMSTEDLEKMINQLSGEEQPTEQPVPTQEPQQIQSSDKSFMGKLAGSPASFLRGAWEGIVDNLSMAFTSEASKQEAANKLFTDLKQKKGADVKRVIDPKTGKVIGEDSELYKIADRIKEMVPKDWKEYDEKAAGDKGKFTNPEFWANTIARQIPNLASVVATGPTAAFSMAGVEKGSFIEMAKQIEEATGQPIDPALLERKANDYGASAGLLEYASSILELGPFKGISKPFKEAIKKSLVKRVGGELAAMGADGLTEASQSVDQYYILGKLLKESGYSEDQVKEATKGWKEDAIDSFIVGFGTAGAIRGAGNIASRMTRQPEQKPATETVPTQETPSTVAEQTQPQIEPTPEMAGVQPDQEAFFGYGDLDTFKQEFNNQSEEGQQLMMSELSTDELMALQTSLEADAATQTEETTQSIPQEEVALEQPQTTSQEIPSEEGKETSQETLLTEEQLPSDIRTGEVTTEPVVMDETLRNLTKNIPVEMDWTSPTAEQFKEQTKNIDIQKSEDLPTELDKFAEEQKNDQENKVGIRGDEQQRETTVKEEPVKETSTGKTESDRILQTPEKVTPVAKPAKVEPKKDVTKYTFEELKNIYESDNSKKKKLRTLASEAGVKVKQGETWQSIIANYAEMHGTPEDKVKAEKFYKQSHSVKTKKSIAQAQEQRVEETGTAKTGKSAEKYNLLSDMENGEVVIYNPDPKESNHHKFIDSIIEDPKKPGKYKIVPTEGNDQLRYAIDVIKGKNGFALQMSDRGLQMIEQSRSGKGEFVRYDEAVKYNDTEESDLKAAALEEEPIKTIEEDTGLAATEQPGAYRDVSHKKVMDKLNDMLSKKKITPEQYKMALVKIDEEFADDGDTRYSKSGESLSTTILNSDPDELQVIEGTQEDKDTGNTLAKNNKNIKFNGIQPGFSKGGKVAHPAFMMFTFEDPVRGTTFTLPLGSTQKDLESKIDFKMKEYDTVEATKEVKKLFKDFKEIPTVRVDDSIKSKSGQRERKLGEKDYGAITTENGKPIVLINPNIDPNEIVPTLIHELIGHFGASKLFNEVDIKLAQHMRDLYQKDLNSEFTQKLAKTYGSQIEKNQNVLFDEWVAGRFEQITQEYFDNGKFNEKKFKADEGILHKVYAYFERLVGKIFDKWFQKDATKEEISDAVKASLQRLGDIKSSTTKQETRYSKEEEKPKTKRKPPKQLSKSQKLATFTEDRIKLMNSTTPKEIKQRFFNFANKHFYTTVGGISPQSYRDQIFKLINDKDITSVNHPNVKRALELINEFSDYMDVAGVYDDVKKFEKYNAKVLEKTNAELKPVKEILKDINNQYISFVDFTTLKRLSERKVVKRPMKRDKVTVSEPSERYQRLIDQEYIDAETMDEDGSKTYRLTTKGEGKLSELREEFNTNNFNSGKLSEMLNEAKRLMKDDVRKKFRDIKDTKKDNVEIAAKEIVTELNTKEDKKLVEDRKNFVRTVMRFIKESDLTTQNLEFITNALDDGEGAFTKNIFEKLNTARNNTLKFGQMMTDYIQDKLSGIPTSELSAMSDSFHSGIVSWVAKDKKKKVKRESFKLESGKTVELTPSQKISISMLSKNEDGLRHLLGGGFSFTQNSPMFKLTSKDIESISKSLTENEKKVESALFDYYKKQGKHINAVSNEDIGYDLATVDNYHPLRVRGDDIQEKIESIKSLEQLREHFIAGKPSNLKARTKSDAGLVLEGAFEALARTSELVEKYVGQALPSKEVEGIIKNEDLKKTMSNKGMDIEYNTIRKLIDAFQTPSTYRSGVGDKAIRAIMNKFTVATLGYKIPTALMQIPSIWLYVNEHNVNPKDVMKVMRVGTGSLKKFNEVKELIWKYSPMLRNRYEGHIDRDIGEAQEASKVRQKFGGSKPFINKVFSAEGAMSLISGLDMAAVTKGWELAEQEMQAKGMKPGTPEFYKAVAKRTEYLVRRTQATYDVVDRPLILNSQNLVMRALTMFTSQPVKMLMMTRRSLHDLKSSNPNVRKRAVIGLVNLLAIQPFLIEGIRFAWQSARGTVPEDEYDSVLSWLKKIAAMNIQMVPILGSIAGSFINGFKPNLGGPTQELVNRSIVLANQSGKIFTGDADPEKLTKAFNRLLDVVIPIQGPKQAVEVLVNSYKYLVDKLDGED